jgi:transcriptional regulator with XRE-family HTH domain
MANKIEPFYKILGSKIQQAREGQKITQAQIGLRLNPPSTRASIANIENGKQRVLLHTFVQLAKALAVDIQELMPAVEASVETASPKDVERELKRKLNLAAPQLKKLAVAARPFSASGRNRI